MRRGTTRGALAVLACLLVLVLAGCSGYKALPADPGSTPSLGAVAREVPGDLALAGIGAAQLALEASATFFDAADIVVLTAPDEASQVRGASLAVTLGLPVLVGSGPLPEPTAEPTEERSDAAAADSSGAPDVATSLDPVLDQALAVELERLGTRTLLVVGEVHVPSLSPDLPLLRAVPAPLPLDALQVVIGRELSEVKELAPGEIVSAVADAPEHLPWLITLAGAVVEEPADLDLATLPGLPSCESVVRTTGTLVITDDALANVAAIGTARAVGAEVLVLPAGASAPTTVQAAGRPTDAVVVIGVDGDLAEIGYRTRVAARGLVLPGGGTEVVGGTTYLALRGLPGVPELGPIGDLGVDGALARLKALATGADVVPTLELVATVATADPGPRGSYSTHEPLDVLAQAVAEAEEAGAMVLLAFQPGRETFVEQLEVYASLLESPAVGVVFEPRWRLGPQEVPGGHSGTLGDAEVAEAVTWLADLTRAGDLPPKLVVVRDPADPSLMVTDRFEIGLVVEADGAAVAAEIPTPEGVDPLLFPPVPAVTAEQVWTDALVRGVEWWAWRQGALEVPLSELLALEPAPVLVRY